MKLTVLLSGGGSNFQSILDNIQSQNIQNVEVIKVIADRECQGINRAIDHKIDYQIVSRKIKGFKEKLANAIPADTDYIILAGFLSIIPKQIVEQFSQRIVNIHPSLLPKFGGKGMYGMNVHRAVVEAKATESGCTVHLVDVGVDTGQTLFQRSVPVLESDTAEDVQKRILVQEHQIFPIAIQYLSLLHNVDFPNAALKAEGLGNLFINKGITNFQAACHYVKNLPYERNSAREFELVLSEEKGVCSTKHALLKTLAEENGLDNIKMVLGVFKMNAVNTPKVAKVLEKYGLSYIPEAHTYFKVDDEIVDFTSSESFVASFKEDILLEQEYTPSQIGNWKVDFHKEFLANYIAENNWSITVDKLWAIREECIEALFSK